jgi:hypothetical protein
MSPTSQGVESDRALDVAQGFGSYGVDDGAGQSKVIAPIVRSFP